MYVNAYGVQTQGRELVFDANSVAPRERWRRVEILTRTTNGLAMMVAEDPMKRRWIIAHTYVVGGALTTSAPMAQFYYGVYAVRRPRPAGVIALAAPCDPDCGIATAHLTDFWGERSRMLVALIPDRL
jgi:hypothetical protein